MKTELVVDAREATVRRILTADGINFTCSNLDVGDFQISSEGLTVLIERKSLADLVSSVSDGRYRDQKARMMAFRDHHSDGERRIAYIIETGTWKFDRQVLNQNAEHNTITGCILNTAMRDGVQVFCVRDTDETCHLVMELLSRMDRFQNSASPASNVPSELKLKLRRMDNLGGPRECLIRQLCQVPGISEKKASTIVATAGATSMAGLLKWIETAEMNLASVKGIGKKLQSAIMNALYGVNEE